MKFNLKEALAAKGFAPIADPFGCSAPGQIIQKDFEKEIKTVWHGIVKATLTVTVRFTSDDEALTVSYFEQGSYSPFKVKTHLSNKRAYKAIEDTLSNNGFVL